MTMPLSQSPTQPKRHSQGSEKQLRNLNALLDTAAVLTNAERIAIINNKKAGIRLEAGCRVSLQLVESLVPQLNLGPYAPSSQEIVLGVKSYQCLIIRMTVPNDTDRILLALFGTTELITDKVIGNLEGLFHFWRQMASIFPDHMRDSLLNVCCACQDVKVEGVGWIKWDEYLDRRLQLSISHTVCDQCCIDLYGHL